MGFWETFWATMWGALAGAVVGGLIAWYVALDLRRRDSRERKIQEQESRADRAAEREQVRAQRVADLEAEREYERKIAMGNVWHDIVGAIAACAGAGSAVEFGAAREQLLALIFRAMQFAGERDLEIADALLELFPSWAETQPAPSAVYPLLMYTVGRATADEVLSAIRGNLEEVAAAPASIAHKTALYGE